MVTEIASAPGKSAHEDSRTSRCWPNAAIAPQLVSGGWIPIPTKLKNASAKIKDGMEKVVLIIIRLSMYWEAGALR